ncbi:hypothetical protein [Campylobacter curvus]|uniref:hypothetical protein n=1 Tax=Campylobacter curvus TaxID=200 RepID=UPI00035D232C|nr:hypothetical protein [Campylobacter curvus]QKF60765.1 hypothetical protein CCVT_0452 [Campylobacter curvus]UEB49087.1 hypothetical protein LK426_05515 [Campylobacter curvus]
MPLSLKKYIKFIFLILVFTGCAAKYQSPNLAKFSEKSFEVVSKDSPSTLYVVHSGEDYRFTMINSLGAPLARRVLKPDGKFETIGFLPPNSAYNELFIKVLDMIATHKKEAEILVKNEKFKVKAIDIR